MTFSFCDTTHYVLLRNILSMVCFNYPDSKDSATDYATKKVVRGGLIGFFTAVGITHAEPTDQNRCSCLNLTAALKTAAGIHSNMTSLIRRSSYHMAVISASDFMFR